MAKCGKEEGEVLEAWDRFHEQFPEGLIPKEDFLASKNVNLQHFHRLTISCRTGCLLSPFSKFSTTTTVGLSVLRSTTRSQPDQTSQMVEHRVALTVAWNPSLGWMGLDVSLGGAYSAYRRREMSRKAQANNVSNLSF